MQAGLRPPRQTWLITGYRKPPVPKPTPVNNFRADRTPSFWSDQDSAVKYEFWGLIRRLQTSLAVSSLDRVGVSPFTNVGHQKTRVRDVTDTRYQPGHGCGPAFPEHNIMQVLHFRVLCYSLLTNLPDT